jgi:hypothetical protein
VVPTSTGACNQRKRSCGPHVCRQVLNLHQWSFHNDMEENIVPEVRFSPDRSEKICNESGRGRINSRLVAAVHR